jgi:hypothetical protein
MKTYNIEQDCAFVPTTCMLPHKRCLTSKAELRGIQLDRKGKKNWKSWSAQKIASQKNWITIYEFISEGGSFVFPHLPCPRLHRKKNQSDFQLAGYIYAMHESGREATRSDNQPYLCSAEGHGKSAEHDMEDGQEEHKDMQLVQPVGWNKRHLPLPSMPVKLSTGEQTVENGLATITPHT